MAFANYHPCTKLMFYAIVFYLSISLSASTDATMKKPIARSLLPLQKKTIVIRNSAINKEVMNIHCSSTESDLIGVKAYPLFSGLYFPF
ncbi:unnamed protein product [Brassica rapa]|uniref:S-protein homolog n=1 Tax=Brassica campestris TaxID=3711 RepID=A0A3P6BH94_BRACM|nr:unnamed protein product [Brassica rapa]VDD02278.1 unnamed protein product [Brassica rapa]